MEDLKPTHCLDSCAVIAYLRDEPGADILEKIFEDESAWLALHACNLTEVYYDFLRAEGEEAARQAWDDTPCLASDPASRYGQRFPAACRIN